MNNLIALALLAVSGHAPSIDQYLQSGLTDATMVAYAKGTQAELKKINEDFGRTYSFPKTTIRYKDPFKLRLDATVEDTTVTYILNGTQELARIPGIHISTHQDLTGKPGRRQTALDFGLLVPSLFESFFSASFVRNDRETGDPVFDVTYQDRGDTSRHRIWVDANRHIVAKREWYNQYGRQLATFFYEDPKQVDGIWFPTRMTVKNVDDKVAGVTRYDSLKVNTGLSDDVFTLGR